MSRYKWLPRGAPKKPDEFVSAVDHAVRFFLNHRVAILLAVLLGLLAGFEGWLYFQNVKNSGLIFRRELVSARNSSDPAGEMEKLLKTYGSEERGGLIHLDLMDIHLQKGETEAALKEIDLAMEKVPLFLMGPLQVAKTRLIWQMGKKDEALKFIDDSKALRDEEWFSDLEFVRAGILEAGGKREESEAIYRKLSEAPEQKVSWVSEEAKKRLAPPPEEEKPAPKKARARKTKKRK